jgi:hypothetical protein
MDCNAVPRTRGDIHNPLNLYSKLNSFSLQFKYSIIIIIVNILYIAKPTLGNITRGEMLM